MGLFVFCTVVLLLMIFPKLAFDSKGNFDLMEKNNTTCVKGLCAILVIFFHLAVANVDGLFVYNSIGYLAVALFFLFSGYGIMYNAINKNDYRRTFFRKRVLKLLVAYIIANVVYVLALYFIGQEITFEDFWRSFLVGQPIVKNSWYIIVILIFFSVFGIVIRLFDEKMTALIMLYSTILYIIFCITTKIGNESVWWNACLCFNVGLFYGVYKKKIDYFIINRRIIKLFILGFTFAMLFAIYGYLKIIVDANEITIGIVKLISAIVFLFFIITLFRFIRIGSPVLYFLGKISIYVYIYHGLIMILFRNDKIYIDSDFLFVIAVLFASVALSSVIYYLNKITKNILLKENV